MFLALLAVGVRLRCGRYGAGVLGLRVGDWRAKVEGLFWGDFDVVRMQWHQLMGRDIAIAHQLRFGALALKALGLELCFKKPARLREFRG
jgi:hypothetical protein